MYPSKGEGKGKDGKAMPAMPRWCCNCGGPNHLARDCWSDRMCNLCWKPGHVARDCKQSGLGELGMDMGGDVGPPTGFMNFLESDRERNVQTCTEMRDEEDDQGWQTVSKKKKKCCPAQEEPGDKNITGRESTPSGTEKKEWKKIVFVADSGASETVIPIGALSGVEVTPGSKEHGATYKTAGGGTMPHEGEKVFGADLLQEQQGG